jgi:fumarylacetoacetase
MTGRDRRIDETHDPGLRSWVDSANAAATDFPIQNLPLGVFRRRGSTDSPRIGIAIGDQILDLALCAEAKLLDGLSRPVREAAAAPQLNTLMALGPVAASELRSRVSRILRSDGGAGDRRLLVPSNQTDLLLPAMTREYTDFYASLNHATNVGRLFRPDNPLLPNYKHLPVAYHARSSSIVIGGTPIRRPWGQIKRPDRAGPVFTATERLDYEVEIGIFVGAGNALGQPVPVAEAEDHLFGVCLLNDWSARDIQAWEYQPLGPFLAKNFATTISPWVVTLEALAPFRVPARSRQDADPTPLSYLVSSGNEAAGGIDITLEVLLQTRQMRTEGHPPHRLSTSSFRDMYWTPAQLLTHHTSNGCNLDPGDLLGSGTVSGPTDDSLGCLLELTRSGREPLVLPTGETRGFLVDDDEVIFRGWCSRKGYVRIGLGECRGTVSAG